VSSSEGVSHVASGRCRIEGGPCVFHRSRPLLKAAIMVTTSPTWSQVEGVVRTCYGRSDFRRGRRELNFEYTLAIIKGVDQFGKVGQVLDAQSVLQPCLGV
jgi:hypothetical protein